MNAESHRNPALRPVGFLSDEVGEHQRGPAPDIQRRYVMQHAVVIDGHHQPHAKTPAEPTNKPQTRPLDVEGKEVLPLGTRPAPDPRGLPRSRPRSEPRPGYP